MPNKLTHEEFTKRLEEAHPGKFKLLSRYKGQGKKNGKRIEISVCCNVLEHKVSIRPDVLISRGCPECWSLKQAASHQGITIEEVLEGHRTGQWFCRVHGFQDRSEFYLYKVGCRYQTQACKKCCRSRNSKVRQELRICVLKHYSPELTCVLCGETHLEFLALDHTNGGGAAERRLFGSSNATYHRSIIRRGFPLEYRVLCHNCHTKYGVRSEYTHKRKPESELSQTIAATTTRERVAKNPEYYREYSKEKSRRTYCNTKAEVLGHYGGKCTCCGVDDLDVLNIDHIEGGGRALTRELKSKGHRFGYAWLKNNGYPAGFRVLCANCNSSRGSYGYCPHEVRSNLVFYENPS